MKRLHASALIALSLSAACSTQGSEPVDNEPTADFRDGSYFYVLGFADGQQIQGGRHAVIGFDDAGKREAIDDANRVARLHPDFTPGSEFHQYDANLTHGETDWDVFASTWWPMSRNGTAWRWQPGANQDYNNHSDVNRLSPMEKYDLMFYPGQEQTVPAVSHCTYPDYAADPENCEEISHPELRVTGPATAWEMQNQGVYQWVEPDSWWGHCNGWASYATAEPLGYPLRDITVRVEDGNVVECTGDTTGCITWRMADIEALMTELYFSDQATFSGRRCNTRPDEIERDEFGRPVDEACRDLNPGSFHVAITGMLGRGARNLATGEDNANPPFIIDHNYDHEVWNFPVVEYDINAQETISEARANELVGASGSNYQFNASATQFRQVTLTYSMVSDSVPTDQLLIRADQRNVDPVRVELNYVLELDANDVVLGGEWIEDPVVSWGPNNKELHPDFVWAAIAAIGYGEDSDDLGGESDNPYIAYSQARALLQCANEPASCGGDGGGNTGGGGGVELNVTDLVAQGDTQDHRLELGAGTYTVTLAHDPTNPGGDADLYVRTGAPATLTEFDCRPYQYGSDETCTVTLDSADTLYIMVHGYDASNPYRLTVVGEGGDTGGGNEEWSLNESGTVARAEEIRYESPAVPAGSYTFEMTGDADADLYVRVGSAPTTGTFDCRPYLNGSAERCSVTLAQEDTIHVMVRGYATSSNFELVGTRD